MDGRVGFFFWPYDPAYMARMATLGERLDYDLVGVADTPGNAMDLWVALGVAAARTERVGFLGDRPLRKLLKKFSSSQSLVVCPLIRFTWRSGIAVGLNFLSIQ